MMKLSLKKIQSAYMSIKNIEKEPASIKWAYGIVKNKALMRADVEGIIASEKNLVEIDNQRKDYCEKHAEKDREGKPIIENGFYKGITGTEPDFVPIMEKFNKAESENDKFLETETDINLYMIDYQYVPEKISPLDFENLSFMINMPEEKK